MKNPNWGVPLNYYLKDGYWYIGGTNTGVSATGIQGTKGEKGDPGLNGGQGEQGMSAYTHALQNGFVGSVSDWLASLKGEQGPKGDTGAQGVPGVQGPYGGVGLTGAPGPKGDPGLNGAKGDPGVPGPRGVPGPQGIPGTRGAQGVQGLKGDKGDKGDPGEDAVITDGSITEQKLATEVQEKLNINLNVKDFGAIGDGIANDTVAFENAITTANGKTLIVPSGTYNVDNINTTGVPINIVGVGNPLIQLVATVDSHNILVATNATSIKISGCTFDGNRIALGDSLDETIFDFINPSNVEICNNIMRNVSREATVCRGTIKNINVHHNVYENVSAHLWCFQGTADNVKFNNNVSNIGRTHGFEFEQCPATRVQMLDNIMNSVTSSCALFETVKHAIVKGNIFTNSQYGVLLKCSSPNAIDDGINYQCDDIIIDDNYFGLGNGLYSTAVGTGIKQYGTIIFKNNTCKLSSAMVAIADAVNIKLINNTNISTSTISQQYKFTNVGTLEVDGLSHADSILANTNYLFYFTGVTTVILNNIIAKTLAKLYSFITTDKTKFYFKNMTGNFGDIARNMKVNANVVSAINCIDTSSTIGVTSAPASSTVDIPALGTYFTATPTSAKTITSLTTNVWMGRKITIVTKAFALTYTPSATLLTKTTASVVVNPEGYISFEWNGTAWIEV